MPETLNRRSDRKGQEWTASGLREALLPPPAVVDNAAMQTEPPKADPPKRKRRWFQFSLRTLMIFTVVVAVGSGWLGKKMEQKRKEREAVTAIVNLGGGVRYDYQKLGTLAARNAEPTGPRWLRNLLGENFFSEVKNAWFTRASSSRTVMTGDVTDADIANLKDFPQLTTLNLSDTKITDDGLIQLKTLSQLKVLFLDGTEITGAGLGNLEGLTLLEDVSLTNSKVTDSALAHIGGFAQLQSLSVAGTKVTDAGLPHLKRLSHL
jgi:Leucine Rich repeat